VLAREQKQTVIDTFARTPPDTGVLRFKSRCWSERIGQLTIISKRTRKTTARAADFSSWSASGVVC